jgi:hypothetical protein
MSIVRENINFQRGINPKQAIKVGLTGKWLNLNRGDLLTIKRDFNTNSENRFNDNSKYRQYFSSKQTNSYLEICTPPNLYDDGCIGLTVYIVTLERKRIQPSDYFIWGTPLEFEERLEITNQIRESLNFERGLDPKDSMKVGRIGERDIKKTLERLVEIRGGRYEINYLKDWGNRTPYIEGTYYMGPGYDKVFRADNFFIRYYPDQRSSVDYFTYGYRIQGKIMKEQILTSAEEGMTEILKHITPLPHDPVREAIHFERGLDPKKAMKIGKNFLPYKKGDHVKVWVPWEQRIVEVRVYEDEELDTDGKTKIKKMISNFKPAWEVRRIWVRYNGEVRTANLAIHPETPEQDMWILHQ